MKKEDGESALRLLKDRDLVEKSLLIRSENEHIVIPLARRPRQEEQHAMSKELSTSSLVETRFEPKHVSSRTLEEELSEKLPSELLSLLPESLDIIGDIAVVELPEEMRFQEKILANGILAVNRSLKVVLAKAGPISGIERVRPVRHLAGEDRTTTIHKESGCQFKVDLGKTYFSPRLSYEHQRVAGMVQKAESVTDMFAGVGPFSIMIAKKLRDVEVNAIDANPEAVKLMNENSRLNRLRGTMHVWLGDARGIINTHLAHKASRVIMNYPTSSGDFVQAACNALKPGGGVIHYYTFAEGLDCERRATAEFERELANCEWKLEQLLGTRKVRGVAPMRWQIVVDGRVEPADKQKSQL